MVIRYLERIKAKARSEVRKYIELQFRLRSLDAVKKLEFAQRKRIERLIQNGNSAAGYIPLISEQTEVIIYNFFSLNYGVRSNIDIILAYVDFEGRIRNADHIVLNHRSVSWSIQLPRLGGNDIIDSTIVIIAANPHIHKNHGSHFGHLRFWGMWNNSCIVHSMPRGISFMSNKMPLRYYDRMMHSKRASQIIYVSSIEKHQFLPNDDVSGITKARDMGYNIQLDDSHCPVSIHHCSPFSRTARIKKRDRSDIASTMTYQNIVAIPPVKGLDIEMYFGEICSPNTSYKCHLEVIDKNNDIRAMYCTNLTVAGTDPIKLSSIFNDFNSGDCAWLRFEPLDGEFADHYINTTYTSRLNQKLFDSVHSHKFTVAKPKTSRSLKFAPFYETGHLLDANNIGYESILAIWGAAETPTTARLRVLSVDNPTLEAVHNIIIPAKAVSYFSGADMIKKAFFDQEASVVQYFNQNACKSKFIVQLESEENNLMPSYTLQHSTK